MAKIRLKENAGDDLPYVYLGKFGIIQNMKVDNLKHPFMCNKIWWFLGIFFIISQIFFLKPGNL